MPSEVSDLHDADLTVRMERAGWRREPAVVGGARRVVWVPPVANAASDAATAPATQRQSPLTEAEASRDLAADLKLCEAATPGPWFAVPTDAEVGTDGHGCSRYVHWMSLTPNEDDCADALAFGEHGDDIPDQQASNFDFIAAARTALPAALKTLLALADRLHCPATPGEVLAAVERLWRDRTGAAK